MAIVKITPLAESDLEEIFVYMAGNNPDSAAGFLRDLGQKFELLAENPTLGRARHDYFVELRSFPHKKYVIFYFPIKDGVEIYRIVHSARNIEDLFEDFTEGLKP
ncbi:MAG TPA: type II toxin-antitoxin system RelE/ParE family toxin [Pyrinomonadaceae bacterium]|nr:type II toxin-antitoxin system RelE/ParE family toxin [Pyrinomonadaceae bacterium]